MTDNDKQRRATTALERMEAWLMEQSEPGASPWLYDAIAPGVYRAALAKLRELMREVTFEEEAE